MDGSQSDRIHFGSIENDERRRNQSHMAVDQEDDAGVSLEDLGNYLNLESVAYCLGSLRLPSAALNHRVVPCSKYGLARFLLELLAADYKPYDPLDARTYYSYNFSFL